MSDILMRLAQGKTTHQGDHGHSHGIVHTMIEGAMIGGVAALLAHLVSKGMGEAVAKWQAGHPHVVSADELSGLLGEDKIAAIAKATGIDPSEVAQHLADHLPGAALTHAKQD